MTVSPNSRTPGLEMQCQFMCSGCPAEAVLQNIARHRDEDPSSNGSILFNVLTRKSIGTVDEAIGEGATTYDEIVARLNQGGGGWAPNNEPERRYGNLTKAEITEMAIRCMLRGATEECTLEELRQQHDN